MCDPRVKPRGVGGAGREFLQNFGVDGLRVAVQWRASAAGEIKIKGTGFGRGELRFTRVRAGKDFSRGTMKDRKKLLRGR